ncbi:NYN domain-containing protein (plasmid) [Xanthomonas citri pv. mangiferaeindicae]|uniref:NYN domain-containing protein n=2 Tax=Xanthomonas TaxID=338 RepID=UPI0005282A2C|nr:NYN domain-containing protein [Xanthomonas citri]MBV6787496.1 NYN domain-containing protein [Xanthomonas campestris pv. uppalii]
MPTAILIDGAYFIKRFRRIEPHNSMNPQRAADVAHRWAVAHLNNPNQPQRELYRIFFYDCAPLEKKMHHPLTKRAVDFAKSSEAVFRRDLHDLLRHKRKVALRLGHLSTQVGWTVSQGKLDDILKQKLKVEELLETDFSPAVRQKGVDMRIGIDISSLSLKHQVDQIVLFAGDADFVPAAKLARREGIDFVLDPMWNSVPDGLLEHIDGMRSVCPRPPRRLPGA